MGLLAASIEAGVDAAALGRQVFKTDVRNMVHIANIIQDDVSATINELYPVLRNSNISLFKVLRPVIEYVTDLRNS